MAGPLRPWELTRRGEDAASQSTETVELRPEVLEAEVLSSELEGGVDENGRMLWALALVGRGLFPEARAVLQPALFHPKVEVLAGLVGHLDEKTPTAAALDETFDRLARSPEKNVPALWMVLGRLHVERGQGDKAMRAYERAAAAYQAERDFGGWASALRETALLVAGRGEIETARRLLGKVLPRLDQEDPQRIVVLLDQARLFALEGSWPSCRSALEAALAAAEKVLSPDDELIAHTLTSLAAARMELGQLDEATESLLLRAHGMRRSSGGEPSPEALEVMLLLGELYRLDHRLKDALPLIARSALGFEKGHPLRAAHAYLIWSQALRDAKMLPEAEEKQARAKDLMAHLPSTGAGPSPN